MIQIKTRMIDILRLFGSFFTVLVNRDFLVPESQVFVSINRKLHADKWHGPLCISDL